MLEPGLEISFLPRSAVPGELESGVLAMIHLTGGQRVHLPTYVLLRRGRQYGSNVLAFLTLLGEIYGVNPSVFSGNKTKNA